MAIKHTKGFTLVEVLIYTGILSITGALLSGVLINTTKIKGRETASIEVNNQLNFALQNIQRAIMDSSVIDITAGVSTSTLNLKFKDNAQNPTQFYISNGVLYKQVATAAAQPVTNSNVVVNAVNFLKISGYTGHDSVQVDLTLSYNTASTSQDFSFSRSLSSAIARVSAATFDSNLIPGADNNYDIGQTTARWNNMYLSGKLGIGTTAPAAQLHLNTIAGTDAFTIGSTTTHFLVDKSGRVGIGTTTPWGLLSVNPNGITGPAFVIGSSTATNLIVTNGGNVGIGTTTPQADLEVVGNIIIDRSADTNDLLFKDDGTVRGTIQYVPGGVRGLEIMAATGQPLSFGAGQTASYMTILSTGKVGIGTTTPQWLLNPASLTASQLALSAGAGVNQWAFRNAGGNLYIATTTVAGTATSSMPALTILNTNSSVGIGTTNPVYNLDVNGDINYTGALRHGGSLFAFDAAGSGLEIYQFSISNNTNWTAMPDVSTTVTLANQSRVLVMVQCNWERTGGSYTSTLSNRINRDSGTEISIGQDLGGNVTGGQLNPILGLYISNLFTGLAAGSHMFTYEVKTTAYTDTWAVVVGNPCKITAIPL